MENRTRIIGTYNSGKNGPLFFITAGIHGNEPAGIIALREVFRILNKNKPQISGEVVGVAGNLSALEKEVRFIDEDLNRTWTEENISSQNRDSSEKKEMFEIISVLNSYRNNNYQACYFLDCHTTSAETQPYISVQDRGENLKWAGRFPVHIIRGFSDMVAGCIDHYLSRTGMTGFVFEAGSHGGEDSARNHEAMIWLALQNACQLSLEDLDPSPVAVTALEKNRQGRKIFDLIYRHGIRETDHFVMEPGFENFQKINKNELLAHQNGHRVLSPEPGYIFMPLYQNQGDDGFFILKEAAD